jgi:hypothetical protein
MKAEEKTGVAPNGYVAEQTAGSIIRNTFAIFFRNFVPLFLVYFIPLFPFALLQLHGVHTDNAVLRTIGGTGYWLVSILAAAGLTVAVSDICIGNRPSVLRSFRRGFGIIGMRILATYALLVAVFIAIVAGASAIGALALLTEATLVRAVVVITAVIAGTAAIIAGTGWYMLTIQIVVLEPAWGRAAMRRSRSLGRGHFLRNAGVVFLCLLIAYIPHALFVSVIYGIFLTIAGNTEITDVVLAIGAHAFAPMYAIASILVYYEMRVRKEAYNIAGLVTDLTV